MQTFNVTSVYILVVSEEFEHIIESKWIEKHIKSSETYLHKHLSVLNVRREYAIVVDINLA